MTKTLQAAAAALLLGYLLGQVLSITAAPLILTALLLILLAIGWTWIQDGWKELLSSVLDLVIDKVSPRIDASKAKRMPKRIILIRHGQSVANVDETVYSRIPDNKIELTAKGMEQAREAGKRLKALIGEERVMFFCSPFTRSRQTFHGISDAFSPSQFSMREDPRIREQEWGTHLSNMPHVGTIKDRLAHRHEVGAFYYRFETGESGADVFDRAASFLAVLYREMQSPSSHENIIIVSHALFIHVFLLCFFRWSVESFNQDWEFGNCQHATLERMSNGKYALIDRVPPLAHLDMLQTDAGAYVADDAPVLAAVTTEGGFKIDDGS
eukprot:TRINITY_DN932_c0_g1_i2.p1 TRINITY_DN932_c0_g1~~TRINITY_DN932_c0_g1_i2.p1  ORF type:complete len:326 (+),score=66.38 TRINITY_DN932_c0_g1_i2:48-1025(+)